jgi:3-oxoacyl-[acyl-carrier-protein] synthase-1
LKSYEAKGRLLTEENSDGFMPGEGAGALLVGAPTGKAGLLCRGIGSSFEKVHIESTEPLRADGLVQAVNSALAEASMTLADTDFRVTDLAGEQYYFKEAALLLTRVLRQRKPEFDLWHPAECTGEIGAAAGILMVAVAEAACRKAYAPGSGILMHLGNDDGRRAAVVFTFEGR